MVMRYKIGKDVVVGRKEAASWRKLQRPVQERLPTIKSNAKIL
jgi:hypothetical protein